MTKIIAILFFLVFFSLNAKASPLDDLVGCFETISINGKEVKQAPDFERSRSELIYKLNDSFYSLETKQKLKSFLLVLFTGENKNWYSYHSFVIFPELGDFTSSENFISYKINEDVYFKKFYSLKKVDHFLDLEMTKNIADDFITYSGVVIFQSKERRMSGRKSFVIKPSACH